MMNRKIVDYQILKYDSIGRLEKAVSLAIRQGWQPIGGVSTIFYGFGDEGNEQYGCFQAMGIFESEMKRDG